MRDILLALAGLGFLALIFSFLARRLWPDWNLRPPHWLYGLMLMLGVIGAMGLLLIALHRRASRTGSAILAGTIVIHLVVLIVHSSLRDRRTLAAQKRAEDDREIQRIVSELAARSRTTET